jgi:hypothetical protein
MVHKIKRILFIIALVSLPILAIQPIGVSAQAIAVASSANNGAASATAITVGNTSYSQTYSIGNGWALSGAWTPVSAAWSGVYTSGNAGAAAYGYAFPGYSEAGVVTAAAPGSYAIGAGYAFP